MEVEIIEAGSNDDDREERINTAYRILAREIIRLMKEEKESNARNVP